MATYALPRMAIVGMTAFSAANVQALDGSTDGIATIVRAPKTGTIDRVGVTWGTVTGTPPTYIFGIEGVTNTRAPDGTYKGGGTPASVTGAAVASTTVVYTLDNSIAVTAGDELAVTVRYSSGTVDGSNFANAAYGIDVAGITHNMPFGATLTAGTWAAAANLAPIAVPIYSDDAIPAGIIPAQSFAIHDTNTGSAAWYAVRFTTEADMRLVGLRIFLRAVGGDAADWKVDLYAGTNTTAVFSATVDQSHLNGANGNGNTCVDLPPTTLTAGTVYRLLLAPTTANNIRLFSATFVNSAMRARYSPILKSSTTSSLATVSWTDSDVLILTAVPEFDQVEVAAGSGAGVPGNLLAGVFQ